MAKNKNIPLSDFVAQYNCSKELVAKLRKAGSISDARFEKQGRRLFIDAKGAMADLKVAKVGDRGKVSSLLIAAGNVAAKARVKAMEKAKAAA